MGKEPARNGIRPTIVSVHDVMPENLNQVLEIINFLKDHQVFSITLLVVSGRDWCNEDISVLKNLEDSGIELAGHGWRHQIDKFKTFRHRLHGLLLSRHEAEHLSLSENAIYHLIEKSYQWFLDTGLAPPSLYVPPAWAMGSISRKQLKTLPYRYYESLFSVYDSLRDRTLPMAVCGYMADTKSRSWFLRTSNAVNQCLIRLPLRIAIHPNDLRLPLAKDLSKCIINCSAFSGYKTAQKA
jgi:predicted deacetylase